ncbi:MAG: universal stress protein [Sediminibacterium sp.]
MKKILLAFDGIHFSDGAFEFARILNERKKILLTAAFLPQVDFANLWSYSGGGAAGGVFIPLVEDGDAEEVVKNIDRFKNLCVQHGIEYRVHKDFLDFALPELKKETRFADLLVIGSEKFYENIGDGSSYLEDLLHGVECPVVLVPEKFNFPKTNILAYDGSESSVYAIKQFAYLLPELTGHPTVLVHINVREDKRLPEDISIEELVARHFHDLTITTFEGEANKYFSTWMDEQKKPLLVSGSFGRSGLSRIFHKSFATDIVKQHRVPLFIAHHI